MAINLATGVFLLANLAPNPDEYSVYTNRDEACVAFEALAVAANQKRLIKLRRNLNTLDGSLVAKRISCGNSSVFQGPTPPPVTQYNEAVELP